MLGSCYNYCWAHELGVREDAWLNKIEDWRPLFADKASSGTTGQEDSEAKYEQLVSARDPKASVSESRPESPQEPASPASQASGPPTLSRKKSTARLELPPGAENQSGHDLQRLGTKGSLSQSSSPSGSPTALRRGATSRLSKSEADPTSPRDASSLGSAHESSSPLSDGKSGPFSSSKLDSDRSPGSVGGDDSPVEGDNEDNAGARGVSKRDVSGGANLVVSLLASADSTTVDSRGKAVAVSQAKAAETKYPEMPDIFAKFVRNTGSTATGFVVAAAVSRLKSNRQLTRMLTTMQSKRTLSNIGSSVPLVPTTSVSGVAVGWLKGIVHLVDEALDDAEKEGICTEVRRIVGVDGFSVVDFSFSKPPFGVESDTMTFQFSVNSGDSDVLGTLAVEVSKLYADGTNPKVFSIDCSTMDGSPVVDMNVRKLQRAGSMAARKLKSKKSFAVSPTGGAEGETSSPLNINTQGLDGSGQSQSPHGNENGDEEDGFDGQGKKTKDGESDEEQDEAELDQEKRQKLKDQQLRKSLHDFIVEYIRGVKIEKFGQNGKRYPRRIYVDPIKKALVIQGAAGPVFYYFTSIESCAVEMSVRRKSDGVVETHVTIEYKKVNGSGLPEKVSLFTSFLGKTSLRAPTKSKSDSKSKRKGGRDGKSVTLDTDDSLAKLTLVFTDRGKAQTFAQSVVAVVDLTKRAEKSALKAAIRAKRASTANLSSPTNKGNHKASVGTEGGISIRNSALPSPSGGSSPRHREDLTRGPPIQEGE